MNYQKLRFFTIFILLITLLAVSCRKNNPILKNIPEAAYVRIFTDFDISTNALSSEVGTYKYLYINGVFDSVSAIGLNSVRASDADIYNRPSDLNTTAEKYIAYNDSYYSWGSIALAGLTDNGGPAVPYFNYYPDYFNRVKVAPVINGFDFYKWAQVPPGSLRITFARSIVTSGTHTVGSIAGAYIDTTVQVEKGKIYSYLLTLGSDNLTYKLVAIQENPAEAKFQPNQDYIRFINVSPDNTGINGDLDVYLIVRGADAPQPPLIVGWSNRDTIINNQFIGTVSGTFNSNAAFLPMPSVPNSIFFRNGLLRLGYELPEFLFKFYPKGSSPATRNPLFVLQSFYGSRDFYFSGGVDASAFPSTPTTIPTGTAVFKYPYIFDPLNGVHLTYNTMVFGIRNSRTAPPTLTLGFTHYVWEPSDESDGFRR